MALSYAVIKSALARKANKKKRNEGGLTAKNKAMAIPEIRTATQGNAPRQDTAYKQKTKRAAPSNPSGSERTKKSSGVNFIIAKKKKAKSNQLPKYRS